MCGCGCDSVCVCMCDNVVQHKIDYLFFQVHTCLIRWTGSTYNIALRLASYPGLPRLLSLAEYEKQGSLATMLHLTTTAISAWHYQIHRDFHATLVMCRIVTMVLVTDWSMVMSSP